MHHVGGPFHSFFSDPSLVITIPIIPPPFKVSWTRMLRMCVARLTRIAVLSSAMLGLFPSAEEAYVCASYPCMARVATSLRIVAISVVIQMTHSASPVPRENVSACVFERLMDIVE